MATKKTASQNTAKANTEPSAISRFITYVEEARAELRKVSWPTIKETRSATFVVLGFVAVMSVLLGLVDLGLSSIIKTILS